MKTFRETISLVMNALQENSGFLGVPIHNVQILQNIPSTAPAIYLFASPVVSNYNIGRGIAKCALFCCGSNNIASEALFESNSIAEKCSSIIDKSRIANGDITVEFDTWYSSLAVSIVEFSFKYQKEVQ